MSWYGVILKYQRSYSTQCVTRTYSLPETRCILAYATYCYDNGVLYSHMVGHCVNMTLSTGVVYSRYLLGLANLVLW